MEWELSGEGLKLRWINRALFSSEPQLAFVFLAYRTPDNSDRTCDKVPLYQQIADSQSSMRRCQFSPAILSSHAE
jgi:hypothetical protein